MSVCLWEVGNSVWHKDTDDKGLLIMRLADSIG